MDHTSFAAMMKHAHLSNLATSDEVRDHHLAEAQKLARQMLKSVPADLLVVYSARAALGVLADRLRMEGVDPAAVAFDAEVADALDDESREP